MDNIKIEIPDHIRHILNKLMINGHEGYIVGGCVRDSIIGSTPVDWDICTSAKPEEIIKIFSGYRVIETGLKHGTVTLIIESTPVEITTFRIDGEYSDNRRPDKVIYTNCLKEDLSRRDFTVNSLAYNEETGLVDFFCGLKDIKEGMIRTVGNASLRFNEDALRILRAVRFAAQLGFQTDADTSKAMSINKCLLKNISAERIATEFCKTFGHGCNSMIALGNHSDIIFEIIPEAEKMYGFDQHNPSHNLDVWNHTLKAVSYAGQDILLNLTMFFHDVGKPKSFTIDDSGVGHFYGHERISADSAEKILTRMRLDNNTIKTVKILIENHRHDLKPDPKQIKKLLGRIGETNFRRLIKVKVADIKAHNPDWAKNRLSIINDVQALAQEILLKNQCFSLKDLAVDGNDLIRIGIPQGKEIGGILNRLLDMVIEEELENEKEVLLEAVEELK